MQERKVRLRVYAEELSGEHDFWIILSTLDRGEDSGKDRQIRDQEQIGILHSARMQTLDYHLLPVTEEPSPVFDSRMTGTLTGR